MKSRIWVSIVRTVLDTVKIVLIAVPVIALVVGSTALAYDSIYKTATASPPCDAANFADSDKHLCQTDNATLSWHANDHFSSVEHSRIRTVLKGSFEETVLSVAQENPAVGTGSAETDIIYNTGDLGLQALGVIWCDDATDDTHCDQHKVRFNDLGSRE